MSQLTNYFNLDTNGSQTSISMPQASKPEKNSGILQWVVLYAGILVQPFFDSYRETKEWKWDPNDPLWAWFLFSIVTSFIIFPAVYKSVFNKDQPTWIQLVPIFISGLGWESLVNTALS